MGGLGIGALSRGERLEPAPLVASLRLRLVRCHGLAGGCTNGFVR